MIAIKFSSTPPLTSLNIKGPRGMTFTGIPTIAIHEAHIPCAPWFSPPSWKFLPPPQFIVDPLIDYFEKRGANLGGYLASRAYFSHFLVSLPINMFLYHITEGENMGVDMFANQPQMPTMNNLGWRRTIDKEMERGDSDMRITNDLQL